MQVKKTINEVLLVKAWLRLTMRGLALQSNCDIKQKNLNNPHTGELEKKYKWGIKKTSENTQVALHHPSRITRRTF